jgi:hypothetical protein
MPYGRYKDEIWKNIQSQAWQSIVRRTDAKTRYVHSDGCAAQRATQRDEGPKKTPYLVSPFEGRLTR